MSKSALLVIDMQECFRHKFGMEKLLPRVKELISKCRKAGVLIIYFRYALNKDARKRPWITSVLRKEQLLVDGDPRTEICSEIKPEKDDIIITKQNYSCFINTDLKRMLDEQGVSSLIICGVSTDACVRATLFDAADYYYDITLVEDCIGSSKIIHNYNMKDIKRLLSFIKIKKMKEI